MGWVITVKKNGRPHWHSDWGAVSDERDAVVFESRDRAEAMLNLCGLYRFCGYDTAVIRTKLPPTRAPTADEMIVSPRQLESRTKEPEPRHAKKPRQLSLL